MSSINKLIMSSTRKLTLALQNNSSGSLLKQVLISNLITSLEKIDSDSEEECTTHWWMQARKRTLGVEPSYNDNSSGLKIRIVFNKQQTKPSEDVDSSSDSDSEDEFENESEEDMDTRKIPYQKTSGSSLRTFASSESDSDSDSCSDSDMEVENEIPKLEKQMVLIKKPQEEASSESDIDIGVEDVTFEIPQIEADYNIHCEEKDSYEVNEESNTREQTSNIAEDSLNCCSSVIDSFHDMNGISPKSVHMAESSPCQESPFSNLEDLSAWRNPGSLDPMMPTQDIKSLSPNKDLTTLTFDIHVHDKDEEPTCLDRSLSSPLGSKEKRGREEVSDNLSPTKRSKCFHERISPLVLPTLSSVFTDA